MWARLYRYHPVIVTIVAILFGAALLVWPAIVNLGPILFFDSEAFLVQGGDWLAIWDKPFIYGPALNTAHGGVSLDIPVALQGLALSGMLWRVQRLVCGTGPLRHVAVCAVLAAASAAPWFASLLMPDIWAPIVVLGLMVLALGEDGRWVRTALVLLTGFAIAVHLAHLPLAAACIAILALFRWRRALVLAAPLVVALAALLATNAAVFGRVSVSPHGAVFALARLSGDGLVEPTLQANCPQMHWRMCAWRGRVPTDSDAFLWAPDGPVGADPTGLAPEARQIVVATLVRDPLGVARAALGNTITQLHRVALGDVLTRADMGKRVEGAIRRLLGSRAAQSFSETLQSQDRLAAIGLSLNWFQVPLLLVGAVASVGVALAGPPRARILAVCVLVAVLANACTTGALSGPHDRYQARIAWILLLPGIVMARRAKGGG